MQKCPVRCMKPEKIEKSDELKKRKVAFLIDEAHRSQDGKMSYNLKTLFIKGTATAIIGAGIAMLFL